MQSLRSSQPIQLSALSLVSVGALYVAYRAATYKPQAKPRPTVTSIPSPCKTLLPNLTQSQNDDLAYPPNLIPGARDVPTPYGSMRVYEWGPEDGRKILMIHGDATPAPLHYRTADALTKRGYRVILYDLWGRGYTSTPHKVPHTASLFCLQVLFAINSSPLSWTGCGSINAKNPQGGFILLGFSLGGGIAVNFASIYPSMIQSLVLLAPAGLLRSLPPDYEHPCLYHARFFPDWYIHRHIAKLLGVGIKPEDVPSTAMLDEKTPTDPTDPAARLDPSIMLHEQFHYHAGFTESFTSGVQYGPIQNEHEIWRTMFRNLFYIDQSTTVTTTTPSNDDSKDSNPQTHPPKRLLLIFGDADTVIKGPEYIPDITNLLQDINVNLDQSTSPKTASYDTLNDESGEMLNGLITWRTITGGAGHDFPFRRWEEVVEMFKQWAD